jgi:hypothetical protein
MICFLLGPLLGFDYMTSSMMGVTESLVETAILTALYQKYFS